MGGARTAEGLALFQRGDLAGAEIALRQAIAERPRDEAALEALGVIALRRGEVGEARELLRRATRGRGSPGAWLNYGLVLDASGERDAAVAAVRKAVRLAPTFAPALAALGAMHLRARRFDEAEEALRRAVEADPNHVVAVTNAGAVQLARGALEEAERLFFQAVALKSDFKVAYANLLEIGLRKGGGPAVQDVFERLVATAPADKALRLTAASALKEVSLFEPALEHALAACALDPADLEAHLSAAILYSDLNQFDGAIQLLTGLGQRVDPPPARIMGLLAHMMTAIGQPVEAEGCFRAQVELEPTSPVFLADLANFITRHQSPEAGLKMVQDFVAEHGPAPATALATADALEHLGDKAGAAEALRPWVEDARAPDAIAFRFGQLTKDRTDLERAVSAISKAIHDASWSLQKSSLLFMKGGLLDQLKLRDEAFAAYTEANALRFATFDEAGQQEGMDMMVRAFTSPEFRALPDAPAVDRPPIFILGMPRSGTTLIEQIVSSHPEVRAGGELHIVKVGWFRAATVLGGGVHIDSPAWMRPDLLQLIQVEAMNLLGSVTGRERIGTDKMPHSFQWVPLIHKLFPDSPILHCRRDPIDNGVSLFFHNFAGRHDYCYDLHNIGVYYRMYHQLMQTWRDMGCRFLDVQYEDTVADLEGVSRRVLDYCGLSWDERVLRYYESKDTVVKTASWDQVSKPIYKSAVQRWRRYEKHLGPLIEALGDLAVV